MPDGSSSAPGAAGMCSTLRPVIKLEAGLLDVLATEAEAAIIARGVPVYQRGRQMVRPATQEVPASRGRMTIAACFADMTQPALIDTLARAAQFVRYDARAKQDRIVDPPKQIAEVLLSRFGEWRVPPVSGIITTPTLRPDHSILCQPGYDPATRLYLAPDPTLNLPAIPLYPALGAATTALAVLDSLLDGFPFVSPTDRSVALSALLTPVCRGAMSVAPLHAFRANTAGSGKSYLADLASAIATARSCPVAAAGRNADETDKRLVGLLLGGFPIVSLDNVNGELGSDLLCQAVERPLVRLRRLGASDISELETRATIFATGNGLRVRGDMTRRTLLCDLDAQMERPETRTFAFDPVERVLADRGRYVAACLTVVRAFVTSGVRPTMHALGSYADYDATVRGALVWLGQADPAQSMERARDDDPDLAELRDVMQAWRETVDGFRTVKQVRELAEGAPGGSLSQALLTIAGGRHAIDTNTLGKWLRAKTRTHRHDPAGGLF